MRLRLWTAAHGMARRSTRVRNDLATPTPMQRTAFGAAISTIPPDASGDTTGVYPYTLSVTMTVNGSPQTLTASDTLVVVNRKDSPFGAGWWLAGYERLVRLGDGSKLWVGGDGSTRRYVRDTLRSGEAYGAVGFDRPDSLVLEGANYVRKLRHRARVEFDAQTGRHVATRDPLGFATMFEHDPASGRLTALVHPAASQPRHRFFYSGSTPLLDSVTAPAPDPSSGPQTRKVTLTHAQRAKVTRITDADGRFVGFGYASTNSVVINSRTNRNGVAQTFGFASNRLVQATVPLNASESAVSTFCPAEIRGLATGGCGSSVLAPADALTAIDGLRPASDANDVTTIKTDRRGAPVVVTDAVGNSMRLYRANRDYPGLVTRTVDKTGSVNEARYDNRGLVLSTIEYAPLGPGRDAVTSYEWDPTWERVTQITQPEGNVVRFAYEPSTGNRIWQEDGRGAASRVDFAYNGGTGNGALLPASLTHPADPQGNRAVDTFEYDALGNLQLERRAAGTSSERVRRITNDAAGRTILTSVDAVAGGAQQRRDSTAYDLVDRVLAAKAYGFGMAPAETLVTANAYDDEGNLRRLERWSYPDVAGSPIGRMISRWGYDRANRVVADTAPDTRVEMRAYDRAGNVTTTVTRRGHSITMAYDALNRLTRRRTPSVTYDTTRAGIGARDNEPYPRRPNSGLKFVIAADSDAFAYDPEGRITSANNGDARVTREYFPGGLLRSERQELRDAVNSTFSHSFLLGYTYDLNKRRTAVRLPAQLVPSGTDSIIALSYDSITAELRSVTDPLGNAFTYQYTQRGEPSALTFPGAYEQRWRYEPDGSLARDTVVNLGGTAGGRAALPTLRAMAFTYDARGNRLTADDPFGFQETHRFSYSGLGYLTSSYMRQYARLVVVGGSLPEQFSTGEQLTYDGLGNIAARVTVDTLRLNGVPAEQSRRVGTSTYQQQVGRLLQENSPQGNTTYRHDASGNVEFTMREPSGSQPSPLEDRFTYYGADERARAADYRFRANGLADDTYRKWVFEQYRYDALGRRVWVRADKQCQLPSNGTFNAEWLECDLSTLRRTVWDGEQELVEIQVPLKLAGSTQEQPASVLEDDVNLPQLPHVNFNDPNPFFGRVLYLHGLDLDHPVGITRYNYVDFFQNPVTGVRVPFPASTMSLVWNAQGKLSLAFCADGRQSCTASNGGRTAQMGLDIPAAWFAYERPRFVTRFFQGTLPQDKQDAARTLYRRERYYGPGERPVHAGGPDRARGRAEPVWIRCRGSRELQRSVWTVPKSPRNGSGLPPMCDRGHHRRDQEWAVAVGGLLGGPAEGWVRSQTRDGLAHGRRWSG
jgi:YD repeat-containing protein